MSYLAKYKKSDFKRLTWEEYGKTLEVLYRKVASYLKEHKLRVEAVIPILRAGAFPGTYLAYRLHVLRVLPVQYHYHFEKGKAFLRQILDLPEDIPGLSQRPTLLVVEGNHCFGLTARTAIADIRKRFPKARILYAADHVDYSFQKVKGAEVVFFGKLTNETRQLSCDEAREKGINPLSELFPWEDLEEEWTTVQGKQFKYTDLKVLSKGKVKKEITL